MTKKRYRIIEMSEEGIVTRRWSELKPELPKTLSEMAGICTDTVTGIQSALSTKTSLPKSHLQMTDDSSGQQSTSLGLSSIAGDSLTKRIDRCVKMKNQMQKRGLSRASFKCDSCEGKWHGYLPSSERQHIRIHCDGICGFIFME